MAVTPQAPATRTLLPTGANLQLHRLALRFACWRRLSAFILLWLQRDQTALRARVPFLFLEFDRGRNWEAQPGVFLALDWPLAELEPALRQNAFAVPGFQFILRLLSLLGRRATAEEASQLARVWQELPEGGVWAHAGVLTSRPAAGHRVSLLLPASAAPGYLQRVAPGANTAAIAALIERYARVTCFGSGAQRAQLDMDVAHTVSPRIGLTLLPPAAGDWLDLLAALVRDGLCHQRCAEAAQHWVHQPLGDDPDDVHVGRPYLSHLKVVVHGNHPLTAKLYLGARSPRSGQNSPDTSPA
ncbi:MAG: hypothetical protein N3C12_08550 [Candidatus Binatia bacterium]|nr:hypothetical protein [Candidatus Binatia bacterium]